MDIKKRLETLRKRRDAWMDEGQKLQERADRADNTAIAIGIEIAALERALRQREESK